MAIEIIKEGKMTRYCPYCKTEFSYHKEDMRQYRGTSFGLPSIMRTIECPICGHVHVVDWKWI